MLNNEQSIKLLKGKGFYFKGLPISNKKIILLALSCFGFVAVAYLLFAPWAHGAGLVENVLGPLFRDAANGLWHWAVTGMFYLNNLGLVDWLTRPWGNLFGQNDSFYTAVQAITNGLKICGSTILSFVILIQMIKIAQKIDSNGTMPAVKEILVLGVYLVIFNALIQNADIIIGGVYNAINDIGVYINRMVTAGNGNQIPPLLNDNTTVSLGGLLAILLVALVMFIVGTLAMVIIYAMVLARAIQLYVMSIFAPCAFAFLGTEQTRQWGVGYIKNFIGVALAGVILLIIVDLTPLIITLAVGDSATFEQQALIAADMALAGPDVILIIIRGLAAILVVALAAIKSGGWARDIVGG